ncbi:hypothetical protein HCN44_008609 [Aphidius gifuensis]|uniref:Uncharacterized protein n=2 Tax=Aphidius gifuensis TaxID=684658 RepID=A0A834XQT3_APHGI|nr:hypothetical protein HCN44_008609 [Aphidius gifuensis]
MIGCDCRIISNQWINVECIFLDYQEVDLHKGSIPEEASMISLSRCRKLRIHAGAFTDKEQPERGLVTSVLTHLDREKIFQNISYPNSFIEVSECHFLVLESNAFKNVRGPLSISITRCQFVDIKKHAFSWLSQFMVTEVQSLGLSSNAFKFDVLSNRRHGPSTKIRFQSAEIAEIPSLAFPSAVSEIWMNNVTVGVIHKDAFCAVMISNLKFSNGSIFEIQSGAFSEQTLIRNFEIVNTRLRKIKMGAFRAAATNFSIFHSRFDEIETAAIEVSAATILFNFNEFHSLQKHAMVFKEWTHISVDYNFFFNLGKDAIMADEVAKTTKENPNVEFTLIGNRINKAVDRSLKFATVSEKANIAKVEYNCFDHLCDCSMIDWIQKITGKNTSVNWMMKSSLCVAGEWVEKCFKRSQGYFSMQTFTEQFCKANTGTTCNQPDTYCEQKLASPTNNPCIHSAQNDTFDVDTNNFLKLDPTNILISILCISIILLITVSILIFSALYMKRREKLIKLSTAHNLNAIHSVTDKMKRESLVLSTLELSVNHFNGSLSHENVEIENDPNEYLSHTENKASQTLPEELTEEYLKDLKNQLNDPECYSHARNIVEHLYDIIKVEENCNNNNEKKLPNHEDNMYETIIPRRKQLNMQKKMLNVGTKVPSLEKLSNEISPLVLRDYAQPTDHQSAENNYVYKELPDVIGGYVKRPMEEYTSEVLARPGLLDFFNASSLNFLDLNTDISTRSADHFRDSGDTTTHIYSEVLESNVSNLFTSTVDRSLPG